MEEPHINAVSLTFLLNFHVKDPSSVERGVYIFPPTFF